MSTSVRTAPSVGPGRRPMSLVKPRATTFQMIGRSAMTSLVDALVEMTLAKPGYADPKIVPIQLGQGR